MKLEALVAYALNKDNFLKVEDYLTFSKKYLSFIKSNLQAVIVSRNENHYRFFQYKKDGTYNVTRPINSNLLYSLEEFEEVSKGFTVLLVNIRDKSSDTAKNRDLINRVIYTAQQSIGACLDALPANKSNTARKINGDLFERFVRLIIEKSGLDVSEGTIHIPVEVDGKTAFEMKYQHDLIVKKMDEIKAIGSVKTSSKDRLDKVFVDKFLYNRLTEKATPHFAIFLNDVQRKGKEGKYGVSATFLPGHFKGYTVKLNPLDGVYYCDIRPNMQIEPILKDHIKTFDHFLFTDMWDFVK
ncbi:hypothetical protein [uncultured Endozoicomonas sp.]|uniref:hypothetical protein n=1 Tax=uncultured Endozoicomonas sp. TaxID=432652 RepID=UPI002609FE13|nr:hypothetical protein [uncultured Endozoicomonas sp.]